MFHNTLLKEIQNIMKTIEIKFSRNAKIYETLDIRKESDIYVSASLGRDSFITYPKFDVEAIEGAGVVDLELIKLYREDKNNIPFSLREKILEKQRQIIIRDYVEKNNYYRMLNGQPDYEDNNFIYVDMDIAERYNIDPSIPLHLLPDEKINTLNVIGYIESLMLKYPDKKYLSYLGYNRIDIVNARIANNFAIIRIDSTTHEALYREFITLYEQSREYFMSVIYIMEYSTQYDLYDNFIGLCIMLMTIQRLCVSMFKATIEHDFIDWGSIQMVFKAYNIPFIENLPMEYQRILLKNINVLLRRKSTDRALFDVCSLLGYERLKIFKYFLMKKHKLDKDENPLFFYKTVTDEFGARKVVEDKEKMYELYFQKVSIDERNLALALTDVKNRVSYEEVVINDPYWWEDEGVKEKILEEEFTYVETKYLSINMIHKMTEMIFELMYAFRLIIDKKHEIEDIYVEIPRIVYNGKFKLFHIVTFLCALMCKRAGFKGNIITTHSKILGVYGFDFKEDFDKIKEIVYANKKYVDPEILKYLENLTIIKPEDVNRVFNIIKDFNDYIVQKMYESKNIKQYHIYKQIFQALMISDATTEMFKKNDGTEAKTFLEYLEDQDYVLYEVVQETEVEFIPMLIDHVLVKLNELMEDLKYLYILNDTNNPVFDAIVALLLFFKSYTVDITSLNIVYLFDSKYYNAIKLIGDLNTFLVEMEADDEIRLRYADQLSRIGVDIKHNEVLILKEFFEFFSNIVLPPDVLYLHDEIQRLSKNLRMDEVMTLKEKIEMSVKIEYIILVLTMRERLYLNANIRFDEDLKLYEKFSLETIFSITDNLKENYSDSIHHIDTLIEKINEKIKMDENVHIDSFIPLTSILELLDFIKIEKELELTSIYEKFEDKIKEVLVKMLIQSVYEKLEDTISIIVNILEKEELNLEEVYYVSNSMKILDKINKKYSDSITKVISRLKIKNSYILKDLFYGLDSKIPLTSILSLTERIDVTQIMELCSTLLTEFREDTELYSFFTLIDEKVFKETIKTLTNIIEKDELTYEDILNIKSNISILDKLKLKYSDNMEFSSNMKSKALIKLEDFMNIVSKIPAVSILDLKDTSYIKQNLSLINADLVDMKNVLESVVKNISYTDNDLLMLDSLSYIMKTSLKDNIKFQERSHYKSNIQTLDLLSFGSDIGRLSSEMKSKTNLKFKDNYLISNKIISEGIMNFQERNDLKSHIQTVSILSLKAHIGRIKSEIEAKSNLKFKDNHSIINRITQKENMKFQEKSYGKSNIQTSDLLSLGADIGRIKSEIESKSNLKFKDSHLIFHKVIQDDKMKYNDSLNIEYFLSAVDRLNSLFSDNISLETIQYYISDSELKFMDNALIYIKNILCSTISLNDDVREIMTKLPIDHIMDLSDKSSIYKENVLNDNEFRIKDLLKDIQSIHYDDSKLSFKSKISSSNKQMSVGDTVNILFSDIALIKNKLAERDRFKYNDTINIIYES